MIKKVFTDGLIQVAILLSLLRSDDVNNFLNRYATYPEVQEILLGNSMGYTQTNFLQQGWHNSIGGEYIHPKNVDSYIQNSVFRDLHALGHGYNRITPSSVSRDSIVTWLVDVTNSPRPQSGNSGETATTASNAQQSDGNGNSESDPASGGLLEAVGGSGSDIFPGVDLSKEDMDLIEILWRQDIDLGIGREMFDSSLRRELEKEQEIEQKKAQEADSQHHKDEQPPEGSTSDHPEQQVQYIVDGETGELVPVPAGSVPVQQTQPPAEPMLDDQDGLSVEEAMRILEQTAGEDGPQQQEGVVVVSRPITREPQPQSQTQSQPQPEPQADTADMESQLENLIASAQAQQLTQNPISLQLGLDRQNSFEQRWSDLQTLLNMTLVEGTSPDMEMPSQSTVDVTALLNNATLAQPAATPANYSFSPEEFPASLLPPQTGSLMGLANSSMPGDSADQEMLGFQQQSMFPNFTEPGYQSGFNQTENLMDLLDNNGLTDLDFSEFAETMQTNIDDASSDSAVSSMGSATATSPSLSTVDSSIYGFTPLDGIEGATGGSDLEPNPAKGGQEKYEPTFTYGEFDISSPESMLNYSSGTNDTDMPSYASLRHVQHNHSYPLQPGQEPRESISVKKEIEDRKARATFTRDIRKAKEMKIPISVEDIVHLPVEEFNQLLQKYSLTESQLQLIRDIRRRGKNKVAAQNCRKRKIDVIDTLDTEVANLRKQKNSLAKERQKIHKELKDLKSKFGYMYDEVFRSLRDESGRPYSPDEYSLQHMPDGNVFLVPKNNTATKDHKEKNRKKRKQPRDN